MAFFSRNNRSRRPVNRQRIIRLELEPLEARWIPSAGYNQLNLTGYQPGMARYTDPNLNGWGMDFAPTGPFCVANTATGVATFYDQTGQALPQVITIPAPPSLPLGSPSRPTGVVYNPTSDFVISENGVSAPAEFLFDTRSGTISGWNPAVDPDHAIIVVDNSTESPKPADYTGLVIAQNSQGQNVLYAADFRNSRIDMFGGSFQSLGSFTDPNVASQYPGHTAWQVEDISGQLFVAFGAHRPGPYGGVIDVFDTDGNLLTPNHFAANAPGAGPLENPWGIVQAPSDFGAFSNDILIGNVEGAGNINVFDPASGAYLGQLQHPDGSALANPGLWDLTFGGGHRINGKTNQLFFDAGPNVPNPAGNGLFGVIQTRPVTVQNALDSGPGSLRDAIAIASSGDDIVFSHDLEDQTVTLTSGQLPITKNLDIKGLGADDLTISGNAAGRIFDISGGVSLELARLTLTGGLADHGGAILNEAGASLTLSHVVLSNNQAVGGLGGGAVFNDTGASLTISHSSLTNNQATTSVVFDPSTGGAGGGAIFNNFGATLIVTDSNLSGNQAITTVGYDSFGGALLNLGGTATISHSTLDHNQASGGGSSSLIAGSGGGAVENQIGAMLTLTDCHFANNQVSCAAAEIEAGIFYFAEGGALDNEGNSTASISQCRFNDNQALGSPGGGEGDGGAIVNDDAGLGGNLVVADSSFTGNQGLGGPDGGSSAGGAVYQTGVGTASFTRCTFTDNRDVGGDGGLVNDLNPFLGLGEGGAIHNDVSMTLESCTFTGNQAIGGNGGAGGNGGTGFYAIDLGAGGAIFNHPQAIAVLGIDGCTFANNEAIGGSNAIGGTSGQGSVGYGRGGGLLNLGIATITNSTFDGNKALGGSGNTGGSSSVLVGTGDGGAIGNGGFFFAAGLTASNLTLSHNQAVGGDGNTVGVIVGGGIGGGLSNVSGATATISNCAIDHNQAIGGQGGTGGTGAEGLGGGIANILGSSLTVSSCTLDHNRAIGGECESGTSGGNGLGGGIYNDTSADFGVSSLTVSGCSLDHNQAVGGEGDDGASGGNGFGGGIYNAGTASLTSCTITHNRAIAGEGDDGGTGGQGIGGGVYNLGTFTFDVATIIAHNHASTSNDNTFGV